MALLGNKIDLQDQRVISYEEGQLKAKELGMLFYETSTKLDPNISEMLE